MPQKQTKQKTKRRGKNEGSIYQRKSDNRWCGSVITGVKTDGTLIRKTIYGDTRQEVAQKVTALSSNVLTYGYTTDSAYEERNFKDLCSEWYDLFVAVKHAPTTQERTRYLLKNHIFKAFGDYDIRNIDTLMLQRFLNDKSKKMSSDTVSKFKHLFNNFFAYAVSQKLILSNPMEGVAIRRVERQCEDSKETLQALRPEIRQDVFKWVSENPVLKPIIYTLTFAGLRPQELIPLQWSTVNLENKTLSILKALNRVSKCDANWNIIERGARIGKTKTRTSVRTVTLPEVVVDALREWKDYCEKNNIVSEFVFPNTQNGKLRTYSGLRSLLNRFIKSHKLQDEKITLYTFRHTFATMLLEERENPKIVASLMGHAKVSTTLDFYSHVINNTVYENTARTLDGVYGKLCSA